MEDERNPAVHSAESGGGYVIAAGTTPDGLAYAQIIVEPDGTARLSNETVERIARRVSLLIMRRVLLVVFTILVTITVIGWMDPGIIRAAWSESTIATSGFGMFGPSRLSVTATCRNTGHEAVWAAITGTAFLDIIQVGDMDGSLFYAYGRGVPNGAGSLYREVHLGPSGTGPHRYGVALARRMWKLTIDGRVVARIPDTFRTWRLRATQVMAEGDLPFGAASCVVPAGRWSFGGYGPLPAVTFGTDWWAVR